MDLDRWSEPQKNPDGSSNKFPVAMKDFARSGFFGLQDHGRPVAYRNIRIKRLDGDTMYKLEEQPHGVALKNPDGNVVFQYLTSKPPNTNLAANSTSCFHPVFTPSGERLTDLAPGDHHHHRGVFLAWHTMQFQWPADFSAFGPLGPTEGFDVERGDFWGWGQYAPTEGRVIKNRGVRLLAADAHQATVEMQDDWMVHDKVMMVQETTCQVRQEGDTYVIDLDYKLTPKTDAVLNQSSFGGFCVRARNDGESYYADAEGRVTLPDPYHSAPKLNWPARPWYDYTITLKDGKTVGCTVIDHPQNRNATWHNPRYIWMINPCVTAAGPVLIKAKETFRLRYRLLIHDGPTPVDAIKTLAAAYRN